MPTLLALMGFTLVALTRDFPGYADLLINRGASASRVARIFLFQSISLTSLVLPFSVLVGGLVGLGRLVADREVMVLEALGLDPRRLIGPVAAFGAGAALVALGLGVAISPAAQRELNRTAREIAILNPLSNIVPKTVHRLGEWKLEAGAVKDGSRVLERVLLWMPVIGETIFSTTAQVTNDAAGRPELVLRDGILFMDSRTKLRVFRFDEMRAPIPMQDVSEGVLFENGLRGMTFGELVSRVRQPKSDREWTRTLLELHHRFAFPVATGLFGLLSLPLVLVRKRTSMSSGALFGLVITIAYYGLVQLGDGVAYEVPRLVIPAAWLPNATLLGVILFLHFGKSRPGSARGRSAERESPATKDLAEPPPATPVLRSRRWPLARYVSTRFIQLAIACLLALVVAYLLVDVLERLEWFARHAASFDEIVRFYSARIPLLISRVTPMGLVAAMALTVGLLTSSGELLGMRTLGISARRALSPALFVCLLVTPLLFVLNDRIVPRTNELADRIKQRDIKGEEAARTAVWGEHGDLLYQVASLDSSRGAAEEIVIYRLAPGGLPFSRIDARASHHVGRGRWQLFDATGAELGEGGHLRPMSPPALVELGEQPSAEIDLMYLSVAGLLERIDEMVTAGEPTTDLEVDLHLKLALPLACFILPALVMTIASTGPAFPSSALTLIFGGAVAGGYLLMSGAFASFGRGGVLPPWLGGWGPNLIGIVLLVGLAWRNQVSHRGD